MSGIKGLAGKKMTKSVKFMGEDIQISKLSVAHVMEIQESAKTMGEDADNFDVLKKIIVSSVDGGGELTDDDFENFPLDELSKLSTEILSFSGIRGEKGKA